jgi:flap endonuclease-1
MGIKKLKTTLRKRAPLSMRSSTYEQELNGQRVAIDAPIYMWRCFCNGQGLQGFEMQVQHLRAAGATPIYVFDGSQMEQKQNELEKRRKLRENNKKKLSELEQEMARAQAEHTSTLAQLVELQEKLQRTQKRVRNRPTNANYKQVQQLLTNMGIRWFKATGDAEQECARMCARQEADVVLSEDMDVIPFLAVLNNGCGRLICDSRPNSCTVIDVEKVLFHLHMTPAAFVDACILSGCDYCTTIPRLGPVRAFDFIQQCESIDNLLNLIDRTKYSVPENFDYTGARAAFGVTVA